MILTGDSLKKLRTLPEASVQMCCTSPPYWGLRDYGVPGQLGLEPTPEAYVSRMVEVFREVRRVLKNDGTLWLNLGDSYAATTKGSGGKNPQVGGGKATILSAQQYEPRRFELTGLKPKDLVGIPWMVAFALRADGWYLRSDIIWAKPNPMPESVTDRPTKAHEYLFLLSKSERYFYDHDAIKEPCKADTPARYERGRSDNHKWADGGPGNQTIATNGPGSLFRKSGNKVRIIADGRNGSRLNTHMGSSIPWEDNGGGRNKRSVWTIATKPYKGAHFATFPPKLIEPCILAGSRPGDVVLDPFAGAMTTGLVAQQHGREFLGIELNPQYVKMGKERLASAAKASKRLKAEAA